MHMRDCSKLSVSFFASESSVPGHVFRSCSVVTTQASVEIAAATHEGRFETGHGVVDR